MTVSCERAAHAANAVIPHTASMAAARNREMLVVGICWDMPRIRPSSVEIAEAVGCCHSTAQRYVEEWQRREWRERYGWLRLVEQWLIERDGREDAPIDIDLIPEPISEGGAS